MASPTVRRLHPIIALWTVLILSGSGFASTLIVDSPRDAQEKTSYVVQAWDFGRDEDRDKDQKPDLFRRRKGRDFPAYLPVRIVPRHPENQGDVESMRRSLARYWLAYKMKKWPWEIVPEVVPAEIDRFLEKSMLDPCLEMVLDGGGIEMHAPPFSVDPAFSYGFELELEATDLLGHTAFAEMVFFDARQTVVDRKQTANLTGTVPWQTLRVGPIDITDRSIVSAQVRLIVLPESGQSITGRVRADRIRVLKMPQLSISLNQSLHLYRVGEGIEIECNASGLLSEVPNINMRLIDHNQREVLQESLVITRDPSPSKTIDSGETKSARTEKLVRTSVRHSDEEHVGWRGHAHFQMPPLEPGFYQLRCELAKGYRFSRDTTFCVLPKKDANSGDRRFGWSMRGDSSAIPVSQIPSFLRLTSVRAAKLPIWINPSNSKQTEELAWLLDRLKNSDIDVVGVFDLPPPDQRKFFTQVGEFTVDSVWEQESVWKPLIDPVLSRACLQLAHFQVGWDDERSFSGNDRLLAKLSGLQDQLNLYGPGSKLALPWAAIQHPSDETQKQFKNFQLSISPPWTPSELAAFARGNRTKDLTYWYSLEGLPLEGKQRTSPSESSSTPIKNSHPIYSLDSGLTHLAESMISCIESGVERTWITNPFDPAQGWLHNSKPGILLLPFRTFSQAFSEKQFLGRLQLPNGSKCQILGSGDEGVAVLTNSKPTVEHFFFGDQCRAFDPFQREIPLQIERTSNGSEQKIEVGTRPILLEGIDLDIIRWAMGFRIESEMIETTLTGRDTLRVAFANPTKNILRGSVRVVAPDVLIRDGLTNELRVDSGGSQSLEIELDLRQDAIAQLKRVRFDITSQGDKESRFSIYREIKIGQDDVEVDVAQSRDTAGNLILRMNVLNRTGRLMNLDCMLYLSVDRPRERTQIIGMEERAERVLAIPRASELSGKVVWIRCHEIGTNRVVNHRLVVNEES